MLPKVTTHCMRCQIELTDPASIQEGIGPICRSKANQILAQELPVAWDSESLGAVLFLTDDSWPIEIRPKFNEVWNKIVVAKSFNTSEEAFKASGVKEDWRAVVKQLAWLGSFTALNTVVREQLASIIRGLGYPQYANFMLNIASASEGKLWLEPGLVKFSGVNNVAGVAALKKLKTAGIGARAEKIMVDGKEQWAWRCPIAKTLPFIDVIKMYWPLTDCTSVLKQLMELPPDDPMFDTKVETSVVTIKDFNYKSFLVIAKPYNEGFYQAIKNMQFNTRSWDAYNGGWCVAKSQRFYLEDILKTSLSRRTIEVALITVDELFDEYKLNNKTQLNYEGLEYIILDPILYFNKKEGNSSIAFQVKELVCVTRDFVNGCGFYFAGEKSEEDKLSSDRYVFLRGDQILLP